MDDLRTRFRRLDRLQPPPDLWREAVHRAGAPTPTRDSRRLILILLVAGLLLAALAGALAVGTLRPPDALDVRRPPQLVAWTATTGQFSSHRRLWVAESDGSNPRALDGGDPDARLLIGWIPDRSSLLYVTSTNGIREVGIDGATRQEWTRRQLCSEPCRGLLLDAALTPFAMSPDGTRVAFIQVYGVNHDETALAILDVRSGHVSEIASTRTPRPFIEGPDWSPDGTTLAYSRLGAFTENGIWVVKADGSGLRQVVPDGRHPRWSADGTRIAFTSGRDALDPGTPTVDVYSIGVDGTGLTRLTDDGVSWVTSTTSSGGIAFVRIVDRPDGTGSDPQSWVMDADGDNKRQVPQTLSDLTAAGCTACIYPGDREAYWQPVPRPSADR